MDNINNGFAEDNDSLDSLGFIDEEDDMDIDLYDDDEENLETTEEVEYTDDEEDEYDFGEMEGGISDTEVVPEDSDDDYFGDEEEEPVVGDNTENVFNSGVDEDFVAPEEYEQPEEYTEDENFIAETEDGYIIEDDRENLVDEYGNLIVMNNIEDNGDAFELKYLDIQDIVVPDRIRHNNNIDALKISVRSTGLIAPITVAPTATEGVYALINGLQRLMACAKTGIRRIPCVINKNAKTTELKVLEALYNHSKPYSIKDILDFIEYLEKDRGVNKPATIEYLMQMDPGDYTKLKDIMNDNDEDIVTPLLNGQTTIAQAFKKLESRRKKESRDEKESKKASEVYRDTGASGTDGIEGAGELGEDDVVLSEEELKDLGFSPDDLESDLEDESLEDMIEQSSKMEGFEPNKQSSKNREFIDPALKKATLQRDGGACRCCGISGPEAISILDFHHIIPVFLGGVDSVDNGITLCLNCHHLVHEHAIGKLHIANIEEMNDTDKEKFKRIIKLGNSIREGMSRRGMKLEEMRKEHPIHGVGRRIAGEEQKSDNM